MSPNNDTIYSLATVNVTNGFTLELPDVGERFVSIQMLTENHMTPFYIYGGGVHTFSTGDFDTDFIVVGICMGTDGTAADVAHVVEVLQPQYSVTGAATADTMIRPDLELLAKVRTQLVTAYSELPNSFGAMQKHTKDVKDWEYSMSPPGPGGFLRTPTRYMPMADPKTPCMAQVCSCIWWRKLPQPCPELCLYP